MRVSVEPKNGGLNVSVRLTEDEWKSIKGFIQYVEDSLSPDSEMSSRRETEVRLGQLLEKVKGVISDIESNA